jgi:hypothetical protein
MPVFRHIVEAETLINASVAETWATLTDTPNYQAWSSMLFWLGGTLEQGAKLHLKLAAPGVAPYEFKPVVTSFREHQQFSWLGTTGVRGIFDGEHFFILKPTADGKTALTNREVFSGLMTPVMKNLAMIKNAQAGFAAMNEEIKAYTEAKVNG